jgi:hypothetical protein
MPQAIPNAQHEFWRPPTVQSLTAKPEMVEVCDGCGSEFMVGARFCHVCGNARGMRAGSTSSYWARYMEFQNIKEGLGLSTASLIAFIIGLGCLLIGAVVVGMIYSVQTLAEFQAVQLYRIQWLLGSVAAFVAGILLKRSSETKP